LAWAGILVWEAEVTSASFFGLTTVHDFSVYTTFRGMDLEVQATVERAVYGRAL
jgi:hypothetical protein